MRDHFYPLASLLVNIATLALGVFMYLQAEKAPEPAPMAKPAPMYAKR